MHEKKLLQISFKEIDNDQKVYKNPLKAAKINTKASK